MAEDTPMSRRDFLKAALVGVAIPFVDIKRQPNSESGTEGIGVGRAVKVSLINGESPHLKISTLDGKRTLEIQNPSGETYSGIDVNVATGETPAQALKKAAQNISINYWHFNPGAEDRSDYVGYIDGVSSLKSGPKEYVVIDSNIHRGQNLGGSLDLLEAPTIVEFDELLSNRKVWGGQYGLNTYTFFMTRLGEVGAMSFVDDTAQTLNGGKLYVEGIDRWYEYKLRDYVTNPKLGLPQRISILGQIGRRMGMG